MTSLVARWATLEAEKRKAEARVKAIKEEQDKLQAAILEDWAEQGVRHVKLDGLGTVTTLRRFKHFKRREATDAQALEAVQLAGFGDLVKREPSWSWSAMNARVKEAIAEGGGLPEEFDAAFEWREESILSLRSG
jgi:hypothetical protein